ncbi:porin family protein [Lentisalinibacter salinarum]|uniref:porin family protein n=1 Tax=Lentisalinibacter salinarum TaxID=2992239 RepID=UPI003865C23F
MRIVIFLLAGLMLGTSALAEGFYVGGGVGFTQIEDEEDGISFDDTPIGWRVFAGYEFTPNFALEGGYLDSGEAEDTILGEDVEADLTAWTLTGLGILPINDSWKVFGKLGYYDGESEVSVLGFSAEDDESGLTLGAGTRYDVTQQFSVRADFDWYDSDIDTLWSLGIAVQFMFGN